MVNQVIIFVIRNFSYLLNCREVSISSFKFTIDRTKRNEKRNSRIKFKDARKIDKLLAVSMNRSMSRNDRTCRENKLQICKIKPRKSVSVRYRGSESKVIAEEQEK